MDDSLKQHLATEMVVITRLVDVRRANRVPRWEGWGDVLDTVTGQPIRVRITLFETPDRVAVQAAGYPVGRWQNMPLPADDRMRQPEITLSQDERFAVLLYWNTSTGWRIREIMRPDGSWLNVFNTTVTPPPAANPAIPGSSIVWRAGDVIHTMHGAETLVSPDKAGAWVARDERGKKRVIGYKELRKHKPVQRGPEPDQPAEIAPRVEAAPVPAETRITPAAVAFSLTAGIAGLLPAPRIAGLLPPPSARGILENWVAWQGEVMQLDDPEAEIIWLRGAYGECLTFEALSGVLRDEANAYIRWAAAACLILSWDERVPDVLAAAYAVETDEIIQETIVWGMMFLAPARMTTMRLWAVIAQVAKMQIARREAAAARRVKRAAGGLVQLSLFSMEIA